MKSSDTGAGFLAIVVVNYGSSQLVADNLGPVFGTTGQRVEDIYRSVRVVVVDNYTTVQESSAIAELTSRNGWELVQMSMNVGFGAASNAGIRHMERLGAESFLLLNPDARIDLDTVRQLHGQSSEDPLLVIAPRIENPDGAVIFRGACLNGRTGRMIPAAESPIAWDAHFSVGPTDEAELSATEGWLTGACLVIHRELFHRIGGFDDRFFLYWEDVDLSVRARRAGGSLTVRTDLVAVHEEHGTQRAGDQPARPATYFRYQSHSRLLFAAHHLDRRGLLRWVAHTPGACWATLMTEGRRQMLRNPSHVFASGWGACTGLAHVLPALVRPAVSPSRRLRHGTESTPLVVLLSFPRGRPQGNPYRLLLEQALRRTPGLTVRNFGWGTAFFSRYQVFHVHWPEVLLGGSTRMRRAVKQALFGAFVLRLRLTRSAVVSTMHNLELPSGLSRVERALLSAFYRRVGLVIRLNPTTVTPPAVPVRTVLHGHYRDHYPVDDLPRPIPGRISFVGLVRRYKGVDQLIRAFREVDETNSADRMSLRVRGRASTEELASTLRDLAAGDDRISLALGFAEDPEFVREIGEAELIVLPYPEMHNSAAVLTALSIGRPVLVPDNEVNRELGREVGPGWVMTYSGQLTGAHLTAAVKAVRARHPLSRPDLEARNWGPAGDAHAQAYRDAYGQRHRQGDDLPRPAGVS